MRRLQSRLSDIKAFRTRVILQAVYDVIKPFKAQVAMCRANNGELMTNKNKVLFGGRNILNNI
jgi:hypothetical protein